jgi:hypothetical protein
MDNLPSDNNSINSENNNQNDVSNIIPVNSDKKNFKKFFRLIWYYLVKYYPFLFFASISYAGSNYGSKIFEKYIKNKLSPADTV